MTDDKLRRVRFAEFPINAANGTSIRIDPSKIRDDPNGTHFLVPVDEYVVVPKDLGHSHKAVDAFWRVWYGIGEPHKHGVYESTWAAIRAALAEIEEVESE